MQIQLTYQDGTSITLPPEFALDDAQLSTQRATVRLPGRVGLLPTGRAYAKPRTLRLSGTFEGLSQLDAEQLARTYRGYLLGRGPIKLKRWADADRYITVRCTKAHDDPHRGRFRGRLTTLSFDLEAADPFWYAAQVKQIVRECPNTYDRWVVNNPGGLRFQQVKVTLEPIGDGSVLVNPSLHNGNGGWKLRYNGTLATASNFILTADGETRTAYLEHEPANNAYPNMNAQWQVDGFPLMPGDNPITYQDEAGSSGLCRVTIEWHPAWW